MKISLRYYIDDHDFHNNEGINNIITIATVIENYNDAVLHISNSGRTT